MCVGVAGVESQRRTEMRRASLRIAARGERHSKAHLQGIGVGSDPHSFRELNDGVRHPALSRETQAERVAQFRVARREADGFVVRRDRVVESPVSGEHGSERGPCSGGRGLRSNGLAQVFDGLVRTPSPEQQRCERRLRGRECRLRCERALEFGDGLVGQAAGRQDAPDHVPGLRRIRIEAQRFARLLHRRVEAALRREHVSERRPECRFPRCQANRLPVLLRSQVEVTSLLVSQPQIESRR